jgi:IS605 OrfB family transposase
MKYMSKKKNTEYLHFEDSSFPSFINKIKSKYSYTNKDHKRVNISFSNINSKKRGLEIIYEKDTGKYYIHYPVEKDWFPTTDKRNDNQIKFTVNKNRVISLDPGIRKFLVGYDPKGKSVIIGEGASKELTGLLLEIDKNPSQLLWRKVKNLIDELHWKTINYLINNYDTIILPDFRVSQMITSKKLSRMTKRLMCQFSFFKFKEKLKCKCNWYNKKLIIVDESYTSCTCTNCGFINETKGKETLNCVSCYLNIDRDIAGSRNIFIKNISYNP